MATNGGGATHVSIGYSGRLDEFKTSGMEDRLIVVAGGGAGSYKGESNNFYGGSGGGYIGGNPRVNDTEIAGCGGTQTEGYAFGKGAPGNGNIGGGGSGWYGGIIGDASGVIPIIYEVTVNGTSATIKYAIPSGASNIRLVYKAGSVPASRSDGTYETITQSSTSCTVTGLGLGNTYYFVIFIGTTVKSEPASCTLNSYVSLWDLVLSDDITNAVDCGSAPTTAQWDSNNVLFYGESQRNKPTLTDGVLYHAGSTDYARSIISFPLKQAYSIYGGKSKVDFIAKSQNAYHDQWINAAVLLGQRETDFLSHFAYNVSTWPDAVIVSNLGIYEDERTFNSAIIARRIQVRFDYGTWEMSDIYIKLA